MTLLYALDYHAPTSRREDAALQHALAWRLLDAAMLREYGAAPGSLAVERGSHGKPRFRDHPARFSLAHCPGLVCCGLSTEEIGVDCEGPRPISEALEERVCTPEELRWLRESPGDRERRFLTLWTRKEAYLKYTGEGLGGGLLRATLRWEGGQPVPLAEGLRMASWDGPGGTVISLCGRETAPDSPVFLSQNDLPQA